MMNDGDDGFRRWLWALAFIATVYAAAAKGEYSEPPPEQVYEVPHQDHRPPGILTSRQVYAMTTNYDGWK